MPTGGGIRYEGHRWSPKPHAESSSSPCAAFKLPHRASQPLLAPLPKICPARGTSVPKRSGNHPRAGWSHKGLLQAPHHLLPAAADVSILQALRRLKNELCVRFIIKDPGLFKPSFINSDERSCNGQRSAFEIEQIVVLWFPCGGGAVNLPAFNASVLFQPRYQHLEEEREKYLTFPDIGCSHGPRELLGKVFKVIFMDDHGESGPERYRDRTGVH